MPKNLSQTLCKKGIVFYQRFISPYFGHHCKFSPSCSGYAFLAVEKHGTIRGCLFSCWRFLRCNPLVKGGIDLP